MKINKKLSTAIVLSLMLGVYGNASAGTNEILYGSSTNGGMAVAVGTWVYWASDLTPLANITDNVASNNNFKLISGYGNEEWKEVYGGFSNTENASSNQVTIDGSTLDLRHVYGGYYFGQTDGKASQNKVTIKNGTVTFQIRGGYAFNGTAESNEVNISGGTNALVYGGYVYNGKAEQNKVYITKGTVKSAVYGGYVDGNGTAESNEVTIVGGRIGDDVYGGKATVSAKDNIVNFGVYEAGKAEGVATVTRTVYGGNAPTSTGNTLNVYTVGNNVGGLKNFQNMNFYIPKDAAAGDTLVAVNSNVNLTDVKVAAGFHNDTTLTYGDKVKLIDAGANVVSGLDGVSELKVADTDFTDYDVMVYQGDSNMDKVETGNTATTLVAEIVGEEANESSKSLVETVTVGTAILAEGGDLLAGAGLANAQAALAIDAEHGAPAGSATLFGAINANKSKIKSGSHVDVKGMNLNLGLVKEIKNNAGKFIVGPVVEYGKGKYDSYLDNGYHGEGDSHFVGGGLVAKQNNNNGMYYEGSVRAGKLMSDYKSNGGNYDSDSTYLAAHLGLGKVVKLNEKNSLDYYGKYFYSHQGSDDTTLHSALDHALHFDGVDSHRTRLGGRLNHVVKENNEVYIGFAWQHEFSSTARATIDGLGTPAPSCKGDTGIMELGWKVSETNKYDVDLGATGSIGKKKGAGINLSFNYKF